ncbi:flagellar cap protein FliD N-terminal domain-containing protein [Brevibacillus choshinensis]|uniref:flagellar cap protein FliD N-terminal domain-containing protein n=1 Tax=Brevibacillus choshinensis TaxID=54911 RepID=UPI002E1CA661|nr:flagellar cap protein FliD N-terminal domain-containing protein [Brevibacillus choshinensis]MED4755609.1 hypothetical protein [Brevibacillus choshinensis]
MKVNRISHIPFSQRVGRYHFQMVQAKLHTPVDPIISYNLQPFYTREQQWMTELSDSLSRLYRYSSDLDKAAREFDPERKDSAINERLAISSDPEAATAEAQARAKSRTYHLDIIRLANTQTNKGKMKESASPTSVSEGQQQFSVVTGDQEESFAFYSHASDSHAQSIQRMENALHTQGHSSVSPRVDTVGSMQALVIESGGTGTDHSFSLHDQKGNSVRALGIQHVETQARDAEFLLDGSLHYSSDNRISIGNGEVRVSMLQAGRDTVSITVSPATERLLQQTQRLVSSFNRLQLFLHEQQETLATQKLETFERVAQAANGVLNQYGIRLLPDGQLELDDQTWLEAVQVHYDEFAEAMKGLSKQFREETLRVQTMPLGSFSRSFDDAGSQLPYASLSPSSLRYLHVASTGLFINLLF